MHPDLPNEIAIVDAGGSLAAWVRGPLEAAGYRVRRIHRVEDLRSGGNGPPGMVLLDGCAPGPGGVPAVVRGIRAAVRAPILQVSGCRAVHDACRTHPVRADAFLVRPLEPEALLGALSALLRRPGGRVVFEGMVGVSGPMEELASTIRCVGPHECSVLIQGETGTGKGRVARAIHAWSPQAAGPFVAVDCGALPDSLLHSELFGHVRGAFTGAVRDRLGLFEASDGGTLFLDEVGNLSLQAQATLLRAIEERAVRRVGESRSTPFHGRIVAATGRSLSALVREGVFRPDLYYRLCGFVIDVPPLRDRPGDVDVLIDHRLEEMGDEGGMEPAARRLLRAHAWPGNVRELFAVVERARIVARGRPIAVEHLPAELRRSVRESTPQAYADALAESSHEVPLGGAAILAALHRSGEHRGRAARILGVSRTTLWRRMRDLGLLSRVN